MASSYPAKFGPKNGINSKDYILHMRPLDGFLTDRPVNLLGHSLTAPSPNLTDALTFTDVELRNGKVVTVSRVARAAQETSRTYTIGIPSALWTPVMEASFANGCQSDFFLIYLCPEDEIYNHFDAMTEGSLNPAVEAEDIITTGDDTNIISFTSELQVPRRIRGWALGFDIIYTSAVTDANLRDVVFISQECAGCGNRVGFEYLIVGGDDNAAPATGPIDLLTEDRFASVVAITGPSTIGLIGTAAYNDGNLHLIAYQDDLVAPTSGQLWRSFDNGVTWSQVTGFTAQIKDIFKAGDAIILVGAVAGGANGYIGISLDKGQTFTEITDTLLTGAPLNAGAYDKDTYRYFFVGAGAELFSGRLSGSTLRLNDLSAAVPTPPASLNAIAVLGKNEIMIGGAAGYLAQSRNGAASFATLSLGTASAIASIAGNQLRTIVAAGTSLFKRDALTLNSFAPVVLQNGQVVTGNYTRVRMGLDENGFNYFIATTSQAEVVLGKPFYPNA